MGGLEGSRGPELLWAQQVCGSETGGQSIFFCKNLKKTLLLWGVLRL